MRVVDVGECNIDKIDDRKGSFISPQNVHTKGYKTMHESLKSSIIHDRPLSIKRTYLLYTTSIIIVDM